MVALSQFCISITECKTNSASILPLGLPLLKTRVGLKISIESPDS